MADKNYKQIIINGHKLVCPVCRGSLFWENKDMINNKWAVLFGFGHKNIENFICKECGNITWFWNE